MLGNIYYPFLQFNFSNISLILFFSFNIYIHTCHQKKADTQQMCWIAKLKFNTNNIMIFDINSIKILPFSTKIFLLCFNRYKYSYKYFLSHVTRKSRAISWITSVQLMQLRVIPGSWSVISQLLLMILLLY